MDAGDGMVEPIDAAGAAGFGPTLAGPTDGDLYALFYQLSPTTTGLFHVFTVPEGEYDIRLSFDMYALDFSGAGPVNAGVLDHTGADNQHVRVDILTEAADPFDTGGTVAANLYLGVDGYMPVMPFRSYSFDLSGDLTPGELYILRFALSVNLEPIALGVDNVSIRSK